MRENLKMLIGLSDKAVEDANSQMSNARTLINGIIGDAGNLKEDDKKVMLGMKSSFESLVESKDKRDLDEIHRVRENLEKMQIELKKK